MKHIWILVGSFLSLLIFISCSADDTGHSANALAAHQKPILSSHEHVLEAPTVCSVEYLYISPTGKKIMYGGIAQSLSCVLNPKSQMCSDDKSRNANLETYQYYRKGIRVSFLGGDERPVFFDENGHTSSENELLLKSGRFKIYESKRRSQHKYIYTGTIFESISPRIKKGYFERNFLKALKKIDIERSKRTTTFNHFFSNQSYIGTIISDSKTGALFYLNINNGNFVELSINYYSINSYTLAKTAAGTKILIADGMPIILDKKLNTEGWLFDLKRKPYSRVILDRTKDDVIGFVSVNEKMYFDPNVPKKSADWIKDKVNYFRTQHHSVLLNKIQFSSRASVLTVDAFDNQLNEIRFIAQNNNNEVVSCKNGLLNSFNEKNVTDDHSRDDQFITINGSPETPVYTFKISNNRQNKKNLIMYFRGGPNASVFSEKTKYLKEVFPLDKNDIVVFDYSGSLSSSLININRLSAGAKTSLQSDVSTISNYVKGLDRDDYNQVVIYSESLSGLIAMDVASLNKEFVDKLILIAPWTHYMNSRDVKPFFNWRSRLRWQQQSYRFFNKALFGIDENMQSDDFRDWMKQKRDNFAFEGEILVFQAEHENRIPLEMAQNYFSQFENVNYKILKGQFHETISKHSDIKDKIHESVGSL